ncbi:MAG: GNAT family N-acetyltransferase [Anaerolineae bacterium]|nr:GNAT family N-acetyltransferase [Anaerolineae bacterium]
MISLEICIDAANAVDTAQDVGAAYAGGAATVELCADLATQGLTPAHELVRVARVAFGRRHGLMVMIRPRAGDFVYTPHEVALMQTQIEQAAEAGADGVVFGLLVPTATSYAIDLPNTALLTNTAKRLGLKVTFHRAFDELPKPHVHAWLDQLIALGVDRVLTCGAALASGKRAADCGACLADLIAHARGRIEIVIAGGVMVSNLPALLAQLPKPAAGAKPTFSVHSHSGACDPVTRRISISMIEKLKAALDSEPAYTLRPHQPGDIGWVISRHGALYHQEYGWDIRFEALVAQIGADFINRFDPHYERCWIAERHGQPVGAVFLVKKDAQTAKLRLLLVEPSARGLGIGKRLVDECAIFARQVGYKKIVLWTNSVLTAARGIYQAAGYRLIESEPHHSFGVDLIGETWELDLV